LKTGRLLLLLAFVFTPMLGLTQSAAADTGFAIEDVEFQYQFADKLQISASIQEADQLQQLTLLVEPEQQELRQFQVSPGQQANVTIDLTSNSIAPFCRVYFWFKAELKDGTIVTSPSYWFDYFDNRFDWMSDTSNLFQIYWSNGDASYGQVLQQVARSGLERATQLLPVVPNIPIEIYVYPDETTLQSVLNLAAQPWVNGHTYLETNRILIAESSPIEDTTDIERTIPHELMHLLQFQLTGQNYAKAPAWLLEGLAVQSELYANPEHKRGLEDALQAGTLQPLANLCAGVSQETNQSYIDYAHSSTVVNYLQKQYGSEVFITLLQNAAAGMECEANIVSVLGISSQQLEKDWENSQLVNSGATLPRQTSNLLWVLLPTLLVLAGVIVLLMRRRHQKAERKEENGNAD
jgi:hypothetical protein